MNFKLSKGFTLVELLIVIAILGVIATIVIAAINPIEQANRGQDVGRKADASQMVSALSRYYTAQQGYPWVGCSGSTFCTVDAKAPLNWASADDLAVGLCGVSGIGCKTESVDGPLVSSLELQKAFLSKVWVGAATDKNRIFVGHAADVSGAVYVCWMPTANSNKQTLINNKQKMIDITAGFTSAGIPVQTAVGTCDTVADTNWGTTKCMECVPE